MATDETKPLAAEALKLTAKNLMEFGVIDDVMREPLGGAHRAPHEMARTLKLSLTRHLRELADHTTEQLLANRYDKFRKMGLMA